jgi:hypothetical protein
VSDLAVMPRVADIPTAPLPAGAGHKPDDPARIHDAAQQFEALLLGQMLHSVREGGSNWLSSGDDAAGDPATDMAEQ